MISRTCEGGLAALVLAAAVGAAAASSAHAQVWPTDQVAEAPAEEAAPAEDDDDMKDIDVSKLDWSQLDVDASTLSGGPAAKTPPARTAAGEAMIWSEQNGPNGASAVSVKQSLSPVWDTRIGADMTVAHEPTTMSELLAEKSANGGNAPQSSGSAWAAISAPGAGDIWDKTAVEARLDPAQERSRLGTSLSKSLPLGEQYSLTLQNGYNLIQQGLVPVPGIIPHPMRNYDTEQSAKLGIAETGTSFTAGQSLSSADDRWLRRIGAEQTLLGGLSVSGSIGETADGTTDKSITAGFKRSW